MILPSFSAACHPSQYGIQGLLLRDELVPWVRVKPWAVTLVLFCFIGIPPRAHSRDSSDSADGRATPSENLVPSSARVDKPPSVLPYFNRPPSALPLMGLPPPPIPPPPPLSSSFGVPPPPPGIHYQHLMPPPPRLPPHLAVPPPGAIPPALHLNPAFFPPPNATVGPPPDTYMKASAPYNHHGR